jgi:hypothetical protein
VPIQQICQTNEQQQNEQPNTRASKKQRTPPQTTGRGEKAARVKIKIWKRVKIPRFQLFHILETDEQRQSLPKDAPNKYMFFGTAISRGKGKNTWNVKWDTLPVQSNVIKNITCTKLTVIEEGEEEKAVPDDAQPDEMEYNSDQDDASPRRSSHKDSEVEFCNMDRQSLIDAESFTMRWGSGKDDVVVWKILWDTEYVSLHEDTFVLPDTTILFLTHSILHHFISGHAKIIDKFLSDPWANYNDTVVKDKYYFLMKVIQILTGRYASAIY